MPGYDYKYELNSTQTMVDGNFSTNEIKFPSANPNMGRGGKFGLHIVVTTNAGGATEGVIIWVVHSDTATATGKHMGRFFALAELTKGKHYFIPCGHSLKQHARALFSKVNTDANAGAYTMWFGPDEDGAE